MKLVSVIIPTYSRPKFLSRAINSVLMQTYPNIEIIVVDDNGEGTENQKYTEQLISDYIHKGQILYVKHRVNRNGSAARNTGFNYSHGDYVAFLDDDDQFLPTKIEKQVKTLENSLEIFGACYCNWAHYNEEKLLGVGHNLSEGNIAESMFLMQNFICGGSSLLVRRGVFEELKGFDESFNRHQDWEFLARFFRKYEIRLVDEVLIHIHVEAPTYLNNPNMVMTHRLKYIDAFKGDINKCVFPQKIYSIQYFQISYSYFCYGQFRNGFKWLSIAQKYHFVGIFNLLKCVYAYFRALIYRCLELNKLVWI